MTPLKVLLKVLLFWSSSNINNSPGGNTGHLFHTFTCLCKNNGWSERFKQEMETWAWAARSARQKSREGCGHSMTQNVCGYWTCFKDPLRWWTWPSVAQQHHKKKKNAPETLLIDSLPAWFRVKKTHISFLDCFTGCCSSDRNYLVCSHGATQSLSMILVIRRVESHMFTELYFMVTLCCLTELFFHQ